VCFCRTDAVSGACVPVDYTKLKRADLHGLIEHVGLFLAGTYA
jgi:hypothetical protein